VKTLTRDYPKKPKSLGAQAENKFSWLRAEKMSGRLHLGRNLQGKVGASNGGPEKKGRFQKGLKKKKN